MLSAGINMNSKSSRDFNKIHLRQIEDPRIPMCKTKIYDFDSSENYLEIDCIKCKNIINAMYRTFNTKDQLKNKIK